MNPLIVYYSLSSNTKKVAEAIAKELKADKEEILDEKSRKNAWGFMKSGFESLFGYKPKIKPTKKDSSKYDLVVIGSPIWARRMASPMRTYISRNKFKKIACFCTMGGGEGKYFKQMEKLISKPKATLAIKEKEIKDNTFVSKVKEFVKKLK